MTKEDRQYEAEFGAIPNTQLERIKYILGKKFDNVKYNEAINKEARKIKKIKKKTVQFTMWKRVFPSRRPRANTRSGYVRMYVPGAAEAGRWFEEFLKENNLPYINTPCSLDMDIYEKTPSSFSISKKVLAELGVIRPWKRTGDFDNYAKGIADSIQHGMLEDDCLVIDSSQHLYYSIKPHADITITYWESFPEYLRK